MSGQRSVDQWLAENYIPQFKRQESGRDPFCPVSDHIPEPCPFCNALVKARADEQTKRDRFWINAILNNDVQICRVKGGESDGA